MTVNVDIQVAVSNATTPGEASMKMWAAAVFQPEDEGELTIRVVDSDEMQALNREFRGVDMPTNVLAFPAEWELDGIVNYIGDVAICATVVEREAQEQGKHASSHWGHIVIHGVLHLLGFDHVNAEDAKIMEAREIELLASFGIANPYEKAICPSTITDQLTRNERRTG